MDRVIRDAALIVRDPFFAKDIIITPPNLAPFTIKGIPVRITQMVEEHEGSSMLCPFSHITIVEQDLTSNGASARKTNKLATMKGWGVSWSDAVQTWNYQVSETMPDSTVGLISLVLKDVQN